ncbi:DUF11 domain-containing protein [Actinokineospora enzanensis]|uniref:DUF11 domain-containing protein n=1 Tax=Actinokineospora enzanensis TaxID=155975 RepID=UPI00037C1D93|nr:DUF11 domain-containing protein [Actinokineospora enzanensis]
MIATAVLSAVLLAAAPIEGDSGAAIDIASETGADADAGVPRLSIAVDNAHLSAVPGDRLAYTVTLRNLGTTDVTGLEITQSVPSGLRFDAAEPAGTTAASAVTWNVDLAPAGQAVFHSTMTVVDSDVDRDRLATVACAHAGDDGPPLVCAAHSARIPVEVASAKDSWVTRNRWYFAGGVIAAAGAALFIRRRMSSRDPEDVEEPTI